MIKKSLDELDSKWKNLTFQLNPFKNSSYYLIKNFDELEMALDEDFNLTETLIVNPFKGPYEAEIDTWSQRLITLSNVLDEWRRMQAQWSYLQPIFDSKDIAHQLKKEYNLFKICDSFYRNLLVNSKACQSALDITQIDDILGKITKVNLDFDDIQVQLKAYLEVKRSKFARFYFLSDDELLSILSETKEVERIQDHLRTVFENIQRLQFDEKKIIRAMFSVEGEKIDFVEPINPQGKQVEDWMGLVEDQMKLSVKSALMGSL